MKNKNLIKIHDVFFISDLIKKYNTSFRLFFNTNRSQYEIHDISQNNSFVISYNKYPDEGLICKLYQTNRENINKTLKLLEEQNEKLTKDKNEFITDNSKEKMKEVISFATKKGDGNLSATQIENIIS
ncbi:MAG: hypothetical protein IJS74_00935 [Clostridia bacterium]|nr:hypothetical protein [Clostridia bacterium]